MKRSIFFCIITIILASCFQSEPSKGQISPLFSPDEKTKVEVSIIEHPGEIFNSWWEIKIVNISGVIEYQNDNTFPAQFNIYWQWDSFNRLWIYNSDDGNIYYMEKFWFTWGRHRYYKDQSDLIIPCNLIPNY